MAQFNPTLEDPVKVLLRNISDEIVEHSNCGVAGCPADAGDVKQWLATLSFQNKLPEVIKTFHKTTAYVQTPGDEAMQLGGNQKPFLSDPGVEMRCFLRGDEFYGICQGPYGVIKKGILGYLHDVIVMRFIGGQTVLIDNGIDQFRNQPFASQVWIWVEQDLLQ